MHIPFLRTLLVALAAGLLSACGGGTSNGPEFKYEAAFEADSNASRLLLYRYVVEGTSRRVELIHDAVLPPSTVQPPPPAPLPLHLYESVPGNAGPLGVAPWLEALSKELEIRNISKSQVPISVAGLDAMRALTQRNPNAASQIYASVRSSVAAAGYATRYAASLTANAQGVFMWASVNDLFGNLAPGRTTNGVIDIGGVSAQVAYAVPAQSQGVAVPGTPITVRGENFRVFVVSYDGLGYSESRRQMILGGEQGSGTALNNCYPNNAARIAPLAYDAGLGGVVIGAGNYVFETCSALYETLVRARAVSRTVAVPGFSGTDFVIPDNLGLTAGATLSPGTLRARLNALCEGPDAWSRVIQPNVGSSVVAQNICANGTFLNTFLFGPNGINAATSNVGLIRQIESNTPRVSRGLVLLDGVLGPLAVWF